MRAEILAEITWHQALRAVEALVSRGKATDFCHLDEERLMSAAQSLKSMRRDEPDNLYRQYNGGE